MRTAKVEREEAIARFAEMKDCLKRHIELLPKAGLVAGELEVRTLSDFTRILCRLKRNQNDGIRHLYVAMHDGESLISLLNSRILAELERDGALDSLRELLLEIPKEHRCFLSQWVDRLEEEIREQSLSAEKAIERCIGIRERAKSLKALAEAEKVAKQLARNPNFKVFI